MLLVFDWCRVSLLPELKKTEHNSFSDSATTTTPALRSPRVCKDTYILDYKLANNYPSTDYVASYEADEKAKNAKTPLK